MITMSCGDRDIKQFENHLLLCRQFSQNFRAVGRVDLLQPFQMRDNFRKCKIAFECRFIFPYPVLNFAINDQADHVHKQPAVESLLRLNPSALRVHFIFEGVKEFFNTVTPEIVRQDR